MKRRTETYKKEVPKRAQKKDLFYVDFSSILAPKNDSKIDKNIIKMLTKTRHEKRSEKMRKRAQHEPSCASKPDLAGKTESAFKIMMLNVVCRDFFFPTL